MYYSPLLAVITPSDSELLHPTHAPTIRWWVRKFGWLVGVTFVPGLISQAWGVDARPAIHQARGGVTDFHHTEWNGLGAVFDIKQSSEGYLWLTTSKGVLRFDGVRFQSVEEVTRGAAHDSEIDSAFLSSDGGLWLTTQAPDFFCGRTDGLPISQTGAALQPASRDR